LIIGKIYNNILLPNPREVAITMTYYRLNDIDTVELEKELLRFFSSHGTKTIISNEGVIEFNKGSLWALTASNFVISGRLRVQRHGYLSCNITFDRTRMWMVNSLMGVLLAVMSLVIAWLSVDQAMKLQVTLSSYYFLLVIFLVGSSIAMIFYELYAVNAAEKMFLKSFETWFKNYLT
jgi:hypothetical protein